MLPTNPPATHSAGQDPRLPRVRAALRALRPARDAAAHAGRRRPAARGAAERTPAPPRP